MELVLAAVGVGGWAAFAWQLTRARALDAELRSLRAREERALERLAEAQASHDRQVRAAELERHGAMRVMLAGLLPVLDHLELALDQPGDGLRSGVRMTFSQFQQALSACGVEPVDPLGQPFDPALHEAVDQRREPGQPGEVVAVWGRGWTWRGRLLRPARVVVRAEADQEP